MLLIFSGGPASAPAEIYKWVDAQGKTHYSDRSPAEAAEAVDVPGGPDEAERREAEARARELIELDQRKTEIRQRQKEQQRREAREDARLTAQRRAACSEAQRDLRVLQQQRPVYWTDERGERVYVDDAERVDRIRTLRLFLKANCPN